MPAYNSARYIDANVGRVLDFFDRAGIDGEVVVADDGSTDGTADAIRRDERVRVLRLQHGGKGAAVRAGMAGRPGTSARSPSAIFQMAWNRCRLRSRTSRSAATTR